MSGSLSSEAEPWGQLVRIDCEGDGDRFPFSTDEVKIGRAPECDLSFPSCLYLSGLHCCVVRDKGGRAHLKDSSTNGTLVDGKKVKREQVEIQDGAVIKLVSHPEKPADSKRPHAGTTEQCQSNHPHPPPSPPSPSSYSSSSPPSPPSPSSYSSSSPPSPSPSPPPPSTSPPPEDITYTFHDLRPGSCRPIAEGLTLEATVQWPIGEGESAGDGTSAGNKRPKNEKSSDVPPAKVPSTGEYLQYAIATQTESGSSMDPVDDGRSGSNAPPPDEDHMGENLICGICQEVFHDCVSLQPCMHCYCAGCYSGWMARASNCPECRGVVERINRNHMINKLVESYLKLYPGKKRSDEDLKELDAKNKIDKDMLYPRRRNWHFDDAPYYSSDDSDQSVPSPSSMRIAFRVTLRGDGHSTLRAAPASLCRQCPGASVLASSSGVTPPPYTCPPFGNHIMCQCCMEPMPVRGADEEGLPPQHCFVCQMSFCHLYWGCSKPSCVGCLSKFRDATIDPLYLDSIVLNNSFESQVLKDYLSSKGKEVQDFFEECMGRLQDGTYSVHDHLGRPLTPDTVTCCHCTIKHLRDLAYLYRKDIPSTELPSSVTGRPNCYYGKNCRTQSHSYGHASRYNHICEQTVF